ncbi:hypothetical protein BGW41_007723 [Actinomortierella wolfii]|nr:hypothetical protein BGW41_007723 [Actinomortierella wolfii]
MPSTDVESGDLQKNDTEKVTLSEKSPPALDHIVPNVDEHKALLRHMRKKCGWDASQVPLWFEQQAEGKRFMVIFYLPNTQTPVGMGGVELEDFAEHDKQVADLEEKRGCVVSLFLYKEYRGQGYLGRMLMVCEEIAKANGLKELTIYGLSKAGGYAKFGYEVFKVEDRNYGRHGFMKTTFLKKKL